jgi:hypothetical protein
VDFDVPKEAPRPQPPLPQYVNKAETAKTKCHPVEENKEKQEGEMELLGPRYLLVNSLLGDPEEDLQLCEELSHKEAL